MGAPLWARNAAPLPSGLAAQRKACEDARDTDWSPAAGSDGAVSTQQKLQLNPLSLPPSSQHPQPPPRPHIPQTITPRCWLPLWNIPFIDRLGFPQISHSKRLRKAIQLQEGSASKHISLSPICLFAFSAFSPPSQLLNFSLALGMPLT